MSKKKRGTTTGPEGQVRPISDHANAVLVGKILTGESEEEYVAAMEARKGLADSANAARSGAMSDELLAEYKSLMDSELQILQSDLARLSDCPESIGLTDLQAEVDRA